MVKLMRTSVLFWYYFLILLIIVSALLLGDFSGVNLTSRFLLGLFLVLLILNPIAFFWSSKQELLKKETISPFAAEEKRIKALQLETVRLQEENWRLRAAEKVKSEFVSRTTHQLRTPLSAIKWTFHMIMNGDLGPVTSDLREFARKGFDGAERVITVINDWLSLDYLQANRLKSKVVAVNIIELIDGVLFEFAQKVKEKNQTLTFTRPNISPPSLSLDPIRLGMVLENLVDNAIKYTSAGGRIEIKINENKLNATPRELEILVSDNGIGIPAIEQEKIFQQFYRSSNATKLAPRGSGLGLFIVKDIIEAQGGKIRFESQEGRGTCFYLTIPLN